MSSRDMSRPPPGGCRQARAKGASLCRAAQQALPLNMLQRPPMQTPCSPHAAPALTALCVARNSGVLSSAWPVGKAISCGEERTGGGWAWTQPLTVLPPHPARDRHTAWPSTNARRRCSPPATQTQSVFTSFTYDTVAAACLEEGGRLLAGGALKAQGQEVGQHILHGAVVQHTPAGRGREDAVCSEETIARQRARIHARQPAAPVLITAGKCTLLLVKHCPTPGPAAAGRRTAP